MDEKDIKIIELLKEDARRPFTEIAKKIGVSEATIRKRIKSLEREGIIKGYTVKVDAEKVGYEAITILGLDVEPNKLLDITNKIKSLDEVKSVSICTGDHMIMAEIWAKNNNHLNKILSEKIGKIKGIQDMCPAIIMDKIK